MPTKPIRFYVNRVELVTVTDDWLGYDEAGADIYAPPFVRANHRLTWETLPVELDALSPFARAVAERITTTANGRIPAELVLESVRPRCELPGWTPGVARMYDGYGGDHLLTEWQWDTLHDYDYHPRRSPLNGHGRETPESYLERHAAEMQRLGWRIRGHMTGTELRAAREALGLTQAALAEALDAPANSVARWERGEVPIPRPNWLRARLRELSTQRTALPGQ